MIGVIGVASRVPGRVVPWVGRAARIAPVADVPEICGSCDERFSGVRSALAANFRDHGEVGAAVAITLEGRLVVDLWAGWPGRTHGYHVNTFGFLVGEIVRRVSGESIGAFFRREVAGPLDADFHFGIGPEHDERIADYLFGDEPPAFVDDDEGRQLLLRRVYLNPPGLSGIG